MNKRKFVGSLFALLSAVTFGFIPLIANFAYDEGVQVNSLLFLRFGIGCIILWLYIFIKRISCKISFSHFKHIFLISALGYTAASSTFFYAFKYISSSLSTIIYYSYPILVVAYEMMRLKKYDYRKVFCLLLTITGLFFIVGIGNSEIKLNAIGILLAIGSAFSYAYFCIGAEEKRTKEMNSTVLSAYVMTICSLLFLIQCLATNQPLLATTPKSYLYIVIMSIVCGILPIITLAIGIKIIGAGSAAIVGAFEPLFVCVLGVAFLNEKLTINMIFGGIMIISAVILLQISDMKKDKKMEDIKAVK